MCYIKYKYNCVIYIAYGPLHIYTHTHTYIPLSIHTDAHMYTYTHNI